MPAFTVQQLAKEWGCAPKHIYDLIGKGELAAFKIGEFKGVRIHVAEVKKLEKRSKITRNKRKRRPKAKPLNKGVSE